MRRKTLLALAVLLSALIIYKWVDITNLSSIKKFISRGGIQHPTGGFFGGPGQTEYLDFGVYSTDPSIDMNAAEVKDINWGTLEPGGSGFKILFIKNRSNPTSILNFTLSTDNWKPPEAEKFMDLSISYPRGFISPIVANATLCIQLTLTVAQNITDIAEFSFDITIVGYA